MHEKPLDILVRKLGNKTKHINRLKEEDDIKKDLESEGKEKVTNK
jgi:hypothetical protein